MNTSLRVPWKQITMKSGYLKETGRNLLGSSALSQLPGSCESSLPKEGPVQAGGRGYTNKQTWKPVLFRVGASCFEQQLLGHHPQTVDFCRPGGDRNQLSDSSAVLWMCREGFPSNKSNITATTSLPFKLLWLPCTSPSKYSRLLNTNFGTEIHFCVKRLKLGHSGYNGTHL